MSIVKRMLAHAGAGLNVAAALALIVGCECAPPNNPPEIPPVPTAVNGVATSETTVSISWGTVQDATEYVIYRNGIALDTTAQAQFTEAGLATCAKYSYQVAALNSGGRSQLSPAVSVLLQPPPVLGTGMVLEEPNGCVDYKVGDTMAIDWELDSLHDAVAIRFSSNGGSSYMIIGSVFRDSVNYQHGPYPWVIPDSVRSPTGSAMPTVSDSCLIKIQEYWATRLKDQSDRMFRITAR